SPAWEQARARWERSELTEWDFGDLPECVRLSPFLNAYPALEPAEKGVNLRLFRDPETARRSHLRGVEALLRRQRGGDLEFTQKYLRIPEEVQPAALYFGGEKSLIEQMKTALARDVFRRDIRGEAEFKAHAYHADRLLLEKAHSLRDQVIKILREYQKTRTRIKEEKEARGPKSPVREFAREVLDDLQVLVPDDFLEAYSLGRLIHLPRYMQAMRIRLERGVNHIEKDRQKISQLAGFQQALIEYRRREAEGELQEKSADIEAFRWLLEEFKVSLFAPELGTAVTVSPKRMLAKMKQIRP
ncbi:MAG: DUF3418 domain-containing protein, partial [Candidatus Aminicenantaceae bacterium]